MAVELKRRLRNRHWQTYTTFCAEYDKVAGAIDPTLVGSWPSRAQFHRWLSGSLRGLPYPHHCRVLEVMFPGVSAAELFAPARISTGRTPTRHSIELVTSGAVLTAAMVEVVTQARECIVSVGSRSREPAYLLEIERALRREPNLIHYRILIGPPHSQVLKDHLLRLVELDEIPAAGARRKRLYVSMLTDLAADHERFFIVSERTAVIVLPSANSPGNFDTGLVVRDDTYVQGLILHGKALYGKRRLETMKAVEDLRVLR